jgi:hypothetical protein
MTDETNSAEAEEQAEEIEPDVEIELSPGDSLNLDELYDEFGEELIDADLQEAVKQRVRHLYDNREQLRQQIKQAQQAQQAQSGQPQAGMQ